MASMGIPSVGKNSSASILDHHRVRSNQISRSNRIVSIPNPGYRNQYSLRISASMAVSDIRSFSPWFKDLQSGSNRLVNQEDSKLFQGKDSIFSDDLDGWVRGSIVDIVKNLKKAPLLAHVYCNNGGLMEVITEKGFAEDWPNLKKEWREGERKYPDGVILVEELKDNEDLDLEIGEEERETKAWGLLIQGKGPERECVPACYLLKTCRVNSGVGLFATHFILVKVNSFRESAFSQIRNSW